MIAISESHGSVDGRLVGTRKSFTMLASFSSSTVALSYLAVRKTASQKTKRKVDKLDRFATEIAIVRCMIDNRKEERNFSTINPLHFT